MTTFLVLMALVGLAGGAIGRLKGSSFWLWFLISVGTAGVGVLAAALYRNERREPRRPCPECGAVVALADQVCMRCGHDLELPEEHELLPPPAVAGRS